MAKGNLRSVGWGLGGLVAGVLVAVVGFVVLGAGESTLMEVLAGTVAVIGITIAFLSVFIFVLPPLLPSR